MRVSTDDQNLNLQYDALKIAGCERIFDDQITFLSKFYPPSEGAKPTAILFKRKRAVS